MHAYFKVLVKRGSYNAPAVPSFAYTIKYRSDKRNFAPLLPDSYMPVL